MSHRPLLHAQSFLLVLREHEARKIPTPAMHRRFSVSTTTGPGPHLKTHESCFPPLSRFTNQLNQIAYSRLESSTTSPL